MRSLPLPSTLIRTLTAVLLLTTIAYCQRPELPPPAATAQLSPKAAYDDAMRPLDTTRHSISNWSDIEVDALKLAIGRAATACAERDPMTVSGDALIDLARLCALGQAWPAVVQSTALYIAADVAPKPLLSQAYASKIDAELHLKDEGAGRNDAEAMLRAVPYDGLVAEAVDEAIDYMQFVHIADALVLGALREPLVLAQIRPASSATPAPSSPRDETEPSSTAPTPTLPAQAIHTLYATGLAFASLQQLGGQPDAARSTVAELDTALPTKLSSDDALLIAAARKRYGLLGKPLPPVALLKSLDSPSKLPTLPAPHAITALLLFPDWCSQCVRMSRQFPESVFTVSGHEAYVYALLAETIPPKPARPAGKTSPPPTARELLVQTPTVVVPSAVLDQFAATDFPFLIVVDAHGVVRVLQQIGEDALQPGGTIDTAIARVGGQWPAVPPPSPKTPAVAKP